MKFLSFTIVFQYFDNFETALKNRYIDICNRIIRSNIDYISSADLNELSVLFVQIDFIQRIQRDLFSLFRDL